MSDPTPSSIDQINPWSRWGIALSYRDGRPALSETALWFLELRHPQTVDREGQEIFLHLDQAYRVIRRADRSWFELVPAPERARR